ncbi:glutamine-dependent NAD(+) synthetase [Candidatus Phycosocius bacilliformis]|uniref:Glutamine-dependent NAD(+) synthetase n=1 Tax=Candidatus Phycosocius bacilliformis TaxID=1445552 RepID=A0A2P2E7K7_9PROT|nr:NAD+ synthase [Candidatus Phycosocius bacilliformis]GBF57041.1 glutamine-dependent NAD(+) synthetase [Candidatus Phycosocius bacilliformis]
MTAPLTTLRILSAQLNPIVGDIKGNLAKAVTTVEAALGQGADLVVFPELFMIGYPPEDLVLKAAAVADCQRAVAALAAKTAGTGLSVIMGTPWQTPEGLHNGVAVLAEGQVQALRFKHELPNYAVFDEKRVFQPGPLPEPVVIGGVRIGLPICEDMWFGRVCAALAQHGAELLIVPNGSPYRRPVSEERLVSARARVRETRLPLLYVNQVGGQDELCFDGGSFALDGDGKCVQTLVNFAESASLSVWHKQGQTWVCTQAERVDQITGLAADYAAMVLSLRDYVNKNGFPGVLLGLSGGIDSALSAAVAADALGADRVRCVMMPSRYTSQGSLDDAADNARRLNIAYDVISIEPAVTAFDQMLQGPFAGTQTGIAEENIQSRSRAVLLMALSNKFGSMVLTTGNKSEMAVGYATLYGDMCGGYNALKDLYKMEVYALARWRNANLCHIGLGASGEVIPPRIIDKAPSAELRENQTDQDSLPPYPALDDMLHGFVEEEAEIEDVIARGHDPAIVRRIQNLLYVAEYKRRQAPPGVKIGTRNFGRDRRYPITNKYRDEL